MNHRTGATEVLDPEAVFLLEEDRKNQSMLSKWPCRLDEDNTGDFAVALASRTLAIPDESLIRDLWPIRVPQKMAKSVGRSLIQNLSLAELAESLAAVSFLQKDFET